MQRSALRVFFERVVIASLPLAGCGGGEPVAVGDLAVADLAAPDLFAGTDDLGLPGGEFCELLNPPYTTTVDPDAGLSPDGGYPEYGTVCYYKNTCDQVCSKPGYAICCGPLQPDGGGDSIWWNCYYDCGPGGRRPAGLQRARGVGGCDVGRHFAALAHLEAASVPAFAILRRELARHGAPAELVRAAERARRDEIRHARLTSRIARAHGATPALVEHAPPSPRTLEAIAIENAGEGCVRETFGALLASRQARAAGDPLIRRVMASIAGDEIRHAELAWAVDAWARRRLDRAARRRVDEARLVAAAGLRDEIGEPSPSLIAAAGLPTAAQAHAMLAAAGELWTERPRAA